MIELRIVGPQFSDPHLFVQWLFERYQVQPMAHIHGSVDRYLELSLPRDIHVMSAAPAHWDVARVYDHILARADAVLLLLNRIQDLRRLNEEVIELVRVHSARLGITPIVLANDPHGNSPRFPVVSASALHEEVVDSWPVLEATIGPFESPLRWSFGAELAWNRLLFEAGATTA